MLSRSLNSEASNERSTVEVVVVRIDLFFSEVLDAFVVDTDDADDFEVSGRHLFVELCVDDCGAG